MVLTKDELITALQREVQLLLHLASKVDPAKLDYRPSPTQRTTLELLQYLSMMPAIHLSGVVAPVLDMEAWGKEWTDAEARAKTLDLQQAKDAIAQQPAMLAERLGPISDTDLRTELEMFGSKASRGSWLVNLLLVHYAAYRMQLFCYLKGSGQDKLNTMNLWVGVDQS